MPADPFPNELVQAMRSGNLVPFIGSGLSIPSGLPSWSAVIELLIKDLDSRGVDVADIRARIRDGQISSIDAPQLFSSYASRTAMLNRVLDAVNGTARQPNGYHTLLTRLNNNLIITTNWDRLLEDAHTRASLLYQPIWRDRQLELYDETRKVQIVKCHGTVDDHESIVFARPEYERYAAERPALYSLLRTTFATRTVLFLGFSLADPNIGQLLERLSHGTDTPRAHYAALFKATSTEREKLGALGVEIIDLHELDDDREAALTMWLKDLGEKTRSLIQGNADRARSITEAIQSEASGYSSGRIVRMRAALGVLSNPTATDPDDPVYGSPEQDELEVAMGAAARDLLAADARNQVRCIVHINPKRQREKGYPRRHLRARLEALRSMIETFPSQVCVAHSPVPIDMNHVVVADRRSYVALKRGDEYGFERVLVNDNRWFVAADTEAFDSDFRGILHHNKALARRLGIDVDASGWPNELSLRLLAAAIETTSQSEYVLACDEHGVVTGEVLRTAAHQSGIRHKSVHVHLFTRDDAGDLRVLTQRRGLASELYRHRVDVAVAGHLEVDDARAEASREIFEELGLHVAADELRLSETLERAEGDDIEFVEVYWVYVADGQELVRQSFTHEVEALYWLKVADLGNAGPWTADGYEEFASLRLRYDTEVSEAEFLSGAIDEIRRVAAAAADDLAVLPA